MKWGYSKCQDSQIVPKCDFENGGTTIEVSILHVLLDIFFNIFTAKCTRHVCQFRDAKKKKIVMHFYDLKNINKMQVAG